MKDLDRTIGALADSVAPLTEQKEAIDGELEQCRRDRREAEAAIQARVADREALTVSCRLRRLC